MNDSVTKRASAGDAAAIAELYNQHYPAIHRYLFYRTGHLQAAEDLTSDVFERMIASLPRYQDRGLPFEAWLIRIAHNVSTDYFRSMNKRSNFPLSDHLPANQTSPEQAATQSLTSDLLAKGLQQINPNQRDVIILRFVEGMSIEQVTQVIGKSTNAVKALQRRGLAALRDVLISWEVSYDELR